jgi:hypothetical protein
MAISNPDAGNNALPFTGAGGSLAMGNACAPGDLIHAFVSLLNATSNAPPTLSDSINTGNYTQIGTAFFDPAGAGFLLAHYYKVANATGTPTISTGSVASAGAGAGGKLCASRFTGFPGAVSLDVGAVLSSGATGTAVSGPAIVTTGTPELLVGCACLEANPTVSANSWTQNLAAANAQAYFSYLIETGAIGASDQWTFTASASTTYGVLTAGFFGGTTTPPAGALNLAGQAPKRVMGIVLRPNTAKVMDRYRDRIRSIVLPGWKRSLAFN